MSVAHSCKRFSVREELCKVSEEVCKVSEEVCKGQKKGRRCDPTFVNLKSNTMKNTLQSYE